MGAGRSGAAVQRCSGAAYVIKHSTCKVPPTKAAASKVREDQIRRVCNSRPLLCGSKVDPITKCARDTEGEGEGNGQRGAGEGVLILRP